MNPSLSFLIVSAMLAAVCPRLDASEPFEIPSKVETRWISFENPTGAKGAGGRANNGRKGAPSHPIPAGQTMTLADLEGPGVIRRIWLTVRGEPEILRGVVVRMFWDGQTQPSVEAPLQDFFSIPFARQVAFESIYFTNPEGRSFNCFIPMPFMKRALVQVENQSAKNCDALFYDIDCTMGDDLPKNLAYFHARYHRENPTTPKKDFAILPRVTGEGRFLGCNVGVRALDTYQFAWFGEGEIKIYVDGDTTLPTLVGTGTEDYVGSAWGLGRFAHLYQGCLLDQKTDGVWGFYRWHVTDPVYFHQDLRVDLQQMSGSDAATMGKELKPADYPELVSGHVRFDPETHRSGWNNFEVPQDVCATAYWYQTLPSPDWGPIESYANRMKDLALQEE